MIIIKTYKHKLWNDIDFNYRNAGYTFTTLLIAFKNTTWKFISSVYEPSVREVK